MILSVRRTLIVSGFLLAGVLSLIPLGRWQADRARTADRHRITRIAALTGPLDGPRLTAYRLATYNCLLYRVGKNPFAIELCFDPHGHLVEAIDRRHYGFDPRVGSVRYDPSAAPLSVAPARLLMLLQRSGGLRGVHLTGGVLPGRFIDAAPVLSWAAQKAANAG